MVEKLEANDMMNERKQMICITATFTAEPLADGLNYWLEELKFPFQIEFAPYNQVFQQLLDPGSLISRNEQGINIVLVRLEDWQRFEKDGKAVQGALEEKVEQNIDELVRALQSAAARSAMPLLVCVCPVSPAVAAEAERAAFFQSMEQRLADEVQAIGGVNVVTSAELARYYPVKESYDAYADEVGHIPYTTAFFTALATMLARKIYALQTPVRKVIVLDCDNTLWKGVCAENGPLGIEIDAPYKVLQEFMVAQQTAGRLLCLCSKNNEKDVFDVFMHHPEMPLKREHILSWRINWEPKSENLTALAKELQLGLDSFIFLDDNPLECAEVQAHCPEVVTLQLPQQPERIPRFLQHAWPFDYLKITETDRQRTLLYRQNMERERARQGASTLEGFLETLELEIQIFPMAPEHVDRLAQLTQRTNQFNVTTIRRSENEIQSLAQAKNLEFLAIEVRDRFGDYGLVGMLAFEAQAEMLKVDTFLLSCRVLGRRVEHHMLSELGRIARERDCGFVTVPFLPTEKNQPALDFLNAMGAGYRQPYDPNGWLYVFPLEIAIRAASDAAIKTAA